MAEDLAIAKQMIADLVQIAEGAKASIQERGGYAANPTASTLLACLHGLVGAAMIGGRDLAEVDEAMAVLARRTLARHEEAADGRS